MSKSNKYVVRIIYHRVFEGEENGNGNGWIRSRDNYSAYRVSDPGWHTRGFNPEESRIQPRMGTLGVCPIRESNCVLDIRICAVAGAARQVMTPGGFLPLRSAAAKAQNATRRTNLRT